MAEKHTQKFSFERSLLQKSPNFSSHSSGLQDKELAVLQSRVNALSKTNSSSWAKPVLISTACAISSIAIIWMGLSLFSSSSPQPPAPPYPPGFDVNDLWQKTIGGDCAALAQLTIAWGETILTNSDSEKTYLINAYRRASQYNTLVQKASTGNQPALKDLNTCWSQVETNVPEATKSSIEEAYNAALIPDYLVLKNKAIDGDSESMNALRDSFQQPELSSSNRAKYSIENAFASKIRSKVELGDPVALHVIESEWQKGSIWDSDQAKSDLRQRYYQAILQKVKSGESEAWNILTTAWYEGKTSVGIGPGYDPTNLLSSYFKQHQNEWTLAEQGDLKTMIGVAEIWRHDSSLQPTMDIDAIQDTFKKKFLHNYQELKNKAMSGDKTAMNAIKQTWFDCEQLIRRNSPDQLCSSISLKPGDKKSIRDAYNLASVPNYLELQKKASDEGDDTAMSTLRTHWEDGTLEFLDTEKKEIEKEYKFRKLYDQKIAEAKSGDWEAMSLLKSYWKGNTHYIIIAPEDRKSSIEADYKKGLPEKYQEAIDAAKNDQNKYDQDQARWKLRAYWEGSAISNEYQVDREDYYAAVIPDYKNLKEKMLEGDIFAKSTLLDRADFFSQADLSSLIDKYWAATLNKLRKGDIGAKISVDFEKSTGRFDDATLNSAYKDYWASRVKIEQANKANPPTRKKKAKKSSN